MSDKNNGLGEDFILEMKNKLEAEKAELLGQVKPKWEELGADEDDSSHEVETYDINVSLSVDAKIKLGQIEEALQRIADGVYGQCEKCGKAIPKERLEVEPDAAACTECK